MASTVTQFPPQTYSSSYFLRNVIKEVRNVKYISLRFHLVPYYLILVEVVLFEAIAIVS
jgi:hypothetical protein